MVARLRDADSRSPTAWPGPAQVDGCSLRQRGPSLGAERSRDGAFGPGLCYYVCYVLLWAGYQ